MALQPKYGVDRFLLEVSRPHTNTHTPGKTPLNEWSARRTYHYLHNTQQTQETIIHALSGIRTRDLNNQAAADLSHRDRHLKIVTFLKTVTNFFPYRVILFYPTTRITPLPLFRVKASRAALAVVTVCLDSGSARFSSIYCGKYQNITHNTWRRHWNTLHI
jgi:hypothetical protein